MTNKSSSIEYFKNEAKKLFKQVKAENAEAKARVMRVLKDVEEITLMRVQHVIAVENGFPKWEVLVKASESELNSIIQRSRRIQLPERKVTPLGDFLRGPGILPTPPHLAAWADFFDTMTMDEQRRWLDEDARRMGVFN